MYVILMFVYGTIGLLMAVLASCSVGMLLSTAVAFVESFRKPRNLGMVFVYLFAASVAGGLAWAGLFLSGMIGDHTDYKAQIFLVVGAVFPGILSVFIIPEIVRDALKITRA